MRQQCKDELGSSMRRSQSYHGLDPLGIPSAVYGAMHDIHASFLHVAQGVKSKKQGVPSFGALPQSKRASFRTSDGGVAGGVGLCPGGISPTGAAAAHPVISMLAEQVSKQSQSLMAQLHCAVLANPNSLCHAACFPVKCTSGQQVQVIQEP